MKKLLGLVSLSLFVAAPALADPIAWSPPASCPDGFTCGALSARLAGHDNDWPGAFVAAKRACDFDALFCEDYAKLHVLAGPQRGGDPQRGLAMLEGMCMKDRAVCSTVARMYDAPPRESGLARDSAKAERILRDVCAHDDFLSCSTLGKLYLKGGPGVSVDPTKARKAYEDGCKGSDHYAAGVCGELADELLKGSFGPPDRRAAAGYLERSCAQGYRCDLAVRVMLDDKDVERAKANALRGCERFYCAGIKEVGKVDPAWADAKLRELCARRRTDACRLLP